MLYEKIKKLCEENGISIRQLEREAGITPTIISRWKTCSPNVINLQKVAKYFDLPIDYFIEGDDENEKE
ncbi:hypothetical protein P261_02251 [Lachnospiraceae bacterium TWA4]|nr:hypothetical protein P261_02251 [Lachnospiraceae bacterium TWA4]